MEEFIDYILYLILIAVIVFTGALIFFSIEDPAMVYRLLTFFLCGLTGGIGFFVRKIVQKRRLGEYYELSREFPQIRKDIQRSTKRLERHSRRIMKEQFPKIRRLCSQAEQRLKKVVEIERTLHSFERKQLSSSPLASDRTSTDTQANGKLYASRERYLHNIQKIEQSQQQNLQQIHEILRFLHELNSQILALKFSEEKHGLPEEIAETIDELLIEVQSLEELT
ncbi:MAG: hypothetical protein GY801_25560 [bacterium]|nr:hypothetical protein [bacterium]